MINIEELEKLEHKAMLAALRRKDMRTVKAIVTLALLRPVSESQLKPKQGE